MEGRRVAVSESLIERISAIQHAMAEGDPTPAEVRGFELTLCGLLGGFAREAVLAEIEFKKVLAASRLGAKSMAEAKVIAEAQPAYGTWRIADINHECCEQALITCRSHGRSLNTEMQMAR